MVWFYSGFTGEIVRPREFLPNLCATLRDYGRKWGLLNCAKWCILWKIIKL
jgi:hypothetical protein